MGDGDMKTEGVITVTDAPELGACVELREGTVGDALRLLEAQRTGITGNDFLFLALSVSLHINGKRYTPDELLAFPMHCANALLRLAPRALAVNLFTPREDGDESEPEPEPDDPKS